jgi:hypothetical protein
MSEIGARNTAESLERIPEELRLLRQWVLVRTEMQRDGRLTKVPYVASKLAEKKASSTNPADWDNFDVALKALEFWGGRFDTIAFVIADGDPYVFIDLDEVLEEGRIVIPEVADIVYSFNSYTEVSCSGKGLHIITRAKKKTTRCRVLKRPWLEVYDHARFVAMTGNLWTPDHSEITEGQGALDELCDRHLSVAEPEATQSHFRTRAELTDEQVISKCRNLKGKKFVNLWFGDTSRYDGDDSSADLALCSMLAGHSSDRDQIDRLFRQSALFREKWDSNRGETTYGSMTIQKALSGKRSNKLVQRPAVLIDGRQADELVQESLAALALNSTRLPYIRGGKLCEVVKNETGFTSIRTHSTDSLLNRMSESANWFGLSADGKLVARFPSRYLAQLILAKGDWPFPPLESLAAAPYFRSDGTIVTQEGYDSASRRYLSIDKSLRFRNVSDCPSTTEVTESMELLGEIIVDFPFADEASRASALALLILPSVLSVIGSKIPIALLDSPVQGSGKGLLCECCSLIHTGNPPAITSPPQDESEWKKTVFSVLAGGCPLVVFDNVDHRVRSATLAAVLTSSALSDRILSKTEFVEFPNRTVWMITGNNLEVSPDIARRSYWIRLLPKTDRPHERTDFVHPDLIQWVRERRTDLLWATMTLVSSWFSSGCPKPSVRPLGGYERWSEVVGGILEQAGVTGFLGNANKLWEEVNAESVSWTDFLEAWVDVWGSDSTTVKELLETLELDNDLFDGRIPDAISDALHGATNTSKVSRLGKALTKMKDRRFGPHGFRLEKCRRGSRGAEWQVCADDPSRVVAARDAEFEALLSAPTAEFAPVADDYEYVPEEEKKQEVTDEMEAILRLIEDPL